MENSEVLDTPEVTPKDGPIQQDVDAINDKAPAVLEQDTNMYTSAKAPQQVVVGEKDHTKDIMNNQEASKTYGYTSQQAKDYDKTVNTTTVQSTGANMSATWDAEFKMGKEYTAKEGEDYSWNKLAAEMAQLDYDQEANQARYESIQAKQELDKAASSAWNDYFASAYSARQTQEKMGWTGGQRTASDLQVAFLKAETASNMYTQDEMQKYGVETKLGIARMYAEANQKTLALQYYQDAIDQALSEADQTGWYIPPEAAEMFKQQEIARQIASKPDATYEEKQRAEQVNKACQAYYDNLGFQRGYAYDENGNVVTEYYGIKTLATLTYEETVRNNKVNEELQREANDISRQNLAATWKNIELQEKNLKLTYSMQNQINSNAIAADLRDGVAKTTKSSSPDNYYVGDNGKAIAITPGTQIIKDNNNYYVLISDGTGTGTYKQVWNSNQAHATEHAEKYGTNNNYRPK